MWQKFSDEEGEEIPSGRMSWLDPVIILASLAAGIASEVADHAKYFVNALEQHYNEDVDSKVFHADVLKSIETITEGGQEDG